MQTERQPLLHLRVLVTRPSHQSEALCRLIEQAGGIPVRLPALVIAAPEDPALARRQLQQLANCEMGIFVSRNAVDKTMELVQQALPPAVNWLAIGQATAAALKEHGYPVALMPDRDFSSEGLLALPELQNVAGKRIAIIRGTGGRELLAEVLRKRGADIVYVETYRSICPSDAIGDLRDILAQQSPEQVIATGQEKPRTQGIDIVIATGQKKSRLQGIDIVIATSTLILQNLLEMSGNYRNRLMQRPLVVLSPRARDWALAAGFTRVYIAPQSDDAGIVTALIQAAGEGL